MIAGNHNLKVVMFLYKELGEIKILEEFKEGTFAV